MDVDARSLADDYSLLGRILALGSQKAQTLQSLASALDRPEEDLYIYWFAVNRLRRSQGHCLPVPFDTHQNTAENEGHASSNSWYLPTWRLGALLEEFQTNEGLAVHYGDILYEPEGGHYQLNLAAHEIVLAAQMENPTLDATQMMRVCVHACEPTNGIELLVSNAGKILLSIEKYREEPITASFIERLYERLTEGISIKEARDMGARDSTAVDGMRFKALESFCATLWRQGAGECVDCGNHTLVNALYALYYLKTFRLFPAGNSVLAYLLYVIALHRAGYHFSAHVPVVEVLYGRSENSEEKHALPADLKELAVECDGHLDWTRFFERTVECIVAEQRWMMTKLDGMSRRRERFRVIIDADETMNVRQKEVLLEAILHSNAEFTYGIHERRYDVSYPCARSDFARLLDLGFLRQHDDGTRHFFVAADGFTPSLLDYLRERCPEIYFRYYTQDGSLRDEYKSEDEAAVSYNKNIGFYEKLLLDKTYIEHYDFRRTPIADYDGPRRRSQREP